MFCRNQISFLKVLYMKHVSKREKVGEKVKTIEKEQFCELIRGQEISMYRYALGVLRNPTDAEDAVGEAVLKAYAHLAQLKNPDRFKAWVMSILANETRTMMSRRSRVDLSDDMNQYQEEIPSGNKEVWHLVMELPREFRDTVILYYYDGFRTKEIADMLKISEGTVKSRLNRARTKLKAALEER